MIQATELRLNNYVKYNGIVMYVTSIESPKPRKEKRFDGKYIIELFDGTGFITATTDQIDGIDLTEELLLGSGFDYYYDGTMILKSFVIDLISYDILHEDSWIASEIKHLHQLQNLYFVITQKELQINLHNQK